LKRNLAGKIQVSEDTNMMLEMAGGFVTIPRGGVEIKGKGLMQTYWLNSLDYKKN